MDLMATICLINQKGGCGKSSTCFHLTGWLAVAGYRVLLVDADPQGSLSQGFFGSQHVESLQLNQTLAVAFREQTITESLDLVVSTPFTGVSIIPANHLLARFNAPEPETLGLAQYALDAVLRCATGYDFTLIDCPPNLYGCSWNALLASDWVLIPVPPEDFGTQGLRAVQQAIDSARKLNPRLRLLGHIVTRYDGRLVVHRAYDQKLRECYRESVLHTNIPEASAFKVALACRAPVSLHRPSSKAAQAVAALGGEILERVGVTAPGQRVA